MEEFKTKQEGQKKEKKVEKVVSGKVVSKKQPLSRKFAETFLTEDIDNVKNYLVFDVAIPAAKKFVSEMVNTAVDMMLFGETRSRSGSRNSSRTSYDRVYNSYRGSGRDDRDNRSSRTTRSYSYDDVTLESRSEAEDVIEHMLDLIDDYGMVSVADLYDLVGIQGTWADNKYGWTNLRNASVSRERDGYLLKLPKALPLD